MRRPAVMSLLPILTLTTAALLIPAPSHSGELRSPPMYFEPDQGQVCMYTLLGKKPVDIEFGAFFGLSIAFNSFGAVQMGPNETRTFPLNLTDAPLSCAVRGKVSRKKLQITTCATDGFGGNVVACVSGP